MLRFRLLFLFITVVSFHEVLSQAPAASEWKTFAKDSYSVKYPSTWEVNESGIQGTTFILLAPLSSETDKFRENVNLLIQDLPDATMTLDNYTKLSLDQIKTMLQDAVIGDSKKITAGKITQQVINYTADLSGFHFAFEQRYWILNQKAYVLTFTSETTSSAAYKKTADEIIASFQMK